MKKLILAIAFFGFAIANAQTPAAPVQEKKQAATVKTVAPKAETKKAEAAPAKKADAGGAVMKKDGTPDKRFKANKAPKGPVKKDGTPDKRFKENKEAKPATK